jgi:hypothetical protein
MLGKKGLGKIYKVSDGFIVCISPVACELKAVAGFFAFFPFG